MKKVLLTLFVGIAAIGIFSSCNKGKTYAQRLNDERKIIERFIDKEGIKVLNEYPKDSIFKENEFYLDMASGVYYNVMNAGSGRRIKTGEEIYIRFKDLEYPYSADTVNYSNFGNLQPETLIFGNPTTYVSTAWIVPIRNIGDGAKVKMIVPFKAGLASDQSAFRTAYYGRIDYRFEN